MNWKNNFKENQELILATCSSKAKPNANIVISLGLIGDKLLVADCQMNTTIKNLKENGNICVISKYLKMVGKVKIYTSGKYFEICSRKNKGYTIKHAILINPKKVFDLDKGKMVI
ncbi:MAG: hypothetical protein NTV81_03635 [Candidatus Komeilibacteria bacterium]|nr:hypothetical protein [Candidatus Komeilibacteria bacterium]